MITPWAQWLVNNNLRFVLYLIWIIILPTYWFMYITEAMDDAGYDFKIIGKIKKKG